MKSFFYTLSVRSAQLLFIPFFITNFLILAEHDLDVNDEPEPIVIQKPALAAKLGDSKIEMSMRFRVESFYGKGLELFQPSPLDQILIPAKHTIDTTVGYALGEERLGYKLVDIKMALRTRGTWGAPESILSTASSTIKDVDAVIGQHNHTINRFVIWMREIWLQVALGGLFAGNQSSNTTLMIGIFPFELGRGIALGSAYAKDPDILGYSPATAIDQYAPGFRFSGDFIPNKMLSFDLYAGVLSNKSDSFKNVNLSTQEQAYGRRCRPERGFGVINYVLAGRLQFRPFNENNLKMYVEPYWLYERQREQKIEFVGDANAQLGTIGLAFSLDRDGLIFDFEFAQNFGNQTVLGWDRNVVSKENRDGVAYFVNTEVVAIDSLNGDTAGKKAIASSNNMNIINAAPQNELFNGQQIGTSNLKNSTNRFSNPYTNRLIGRMFVADLAYRFSKNYRLASEIGFATGDINPNRDIYEYGDSNKDGVYRGFISLQEAYSGNLIRSAFLLNGTASVPRVSNFAAPGTGNNAANVITRFTNIIYWGNSLEIKGLLDDKPWTCMPNIISYWQEYPLYIFDTTTKTSIANQARNWLGLEANISADIALMQDCKFFFIGAIFFPGSYYYDIAGKPINKDMSKALEQIAKNGSAKQDTLFVSTYPAFFMNTGIEYRF